jgi:D-glycero-D-manno-heptose 1,7-bisphosphate phosphatase
VSVNFALLDKTHYSLFMKAVFFDRDGTLIIDKHYLHDPDEVEYFKDTFSALKSIQSKGYQLFMVTNQSGIGRGMFTEDQMHKVHNKMLKDFEHVGILMRDIKFCPHSPDDQCDCRKPSPRMIDELVKQYNIDRFNSYMIGDKTIDAECGENARVKGFMIIKEDPKYRSFKSLTEFADFLP